MWKVLGITAAAVLLWSADASAQFRPFETRDEARQRHGAERWQQYEQRGHQAPLGGYGDRLSDPAPRGTERPGYSAPQGYGSPSWGYERQQFGR